MKTPLAFLTMIVGAFMMTHIAPIAHAQSSSADAKTIFSAAFELYKAGQCSPAVPVFERGLRLQPTNGLAHYYLAECLLATGMTNEAVAHYLDAARFSPTSREGIMAAAKAADIEKRESDQRAAQQRAAEQRAAEQRAAEERIAEQRVADQRATEQRVAEQRARKAAEAEQGLRRRDGLLWTGSDNGSDVNWNDALAWCERKGNGWRLPTVNELQSLANASDAVKSTCGGRKCKAPPDFRLTRDYFWSSETGGCAGAWVVEFDLGWKNCIIVSEIQLRALCVRAAD